LKRDAERWRRPTAERDGDYQRVSYGRCTEREREREREEICRKDGDCMEEKF